MDALHQKRVLITGAAGFLESHLCDRFVAEGFQVIGMDNLLTRQLQNKTLTIFGNERQPRSFCYVSDQIEGIYKLLFSDYQLQVNIGNPDEMTILQLAKEILTYTKSKTEISYSTLPIDAPKQRRPDISTAKKILNWSPVIDRKIGLQKTIEYYRNLK